MNTLRTGGLIGVIGILVLGCMETPAPLQQNLLRHRPGTVLDSSVVERDSDRLDQLAVVVSNHVSTQDRARALGDLRASLEEASHGQVRIDPLGSVDPGDMPDAQDASQRAAIPLVARARRRHDGGVLVVRVLAWSVRDDGSPATRSAAIKASDGRWKTGVWLSPWLELDGLLLDAQSGAENLHLRLRCAVSWSMPPGASPGPADQPSSWSWMAGARARTIRKVMTRAARYLAAPHLRGAATRQ